MYKSKFFLMNVFIFLFNFACADRVIHVMPGSFGNIFDINVKIGNAQITCYRLKKALKKIGIDLRQGSSLESLNNPEYIVYFDMRDDLTLLQKYPKDKGVLFLWEPSSIKKDAWDTKNQDLFGTVFTWDNTLVDNKKYFNFHYPQPTLTMADDALDFNAKKLCVLIASNRESSDPNQIYTERKKAIQFFENGKKNEFDLYGSDWNKSKYRTYKGYVNNKIDCLKQYKFCICYENTRGLKGYVTEKIFDCFVAGCVPVYWGADNITDYVPKNCFIDRRDFDSIEAVYTHLKSLSEEQYNKYIENIRCYLTSDLANKFSSDYFIKNFIKVLELEPEKKSEATKKVGYKSQYGQDQFVNEQFYQNKRNGVFVDIGAHDGLTLSNTYFFEKDLGWSGICVEPIPDVFAQLEKRRNCICVQGAISDTDKTAEFLRVSGYSEMLSGLVDKYDNRHLNRVDSEVNSHGGNAEKIIVQCYKLNDLLEKNNMYRVDYMSIDTEGGELDILKSIDYDRFAIDVIDVENNYKDDSIKRFLASKGYHLIKRLMCDEIYQKKCD